MEATAPSVEDQSVVGRVADMAAIDAFLDAASREPSGLVLVGQAGIGKTVLWRAALNGARDRGIQVLASRPSQAEVTLDHAGLADLFADVDEATLRGLPAAQAAALSVALRRSEPGALAPDPLSIGLATLGLLRGLADSSAVLVAIDDVQWLDAASAWALEFAFRRQDRRPIAFLSTERSPGGQVGVTATRIGGPSVATRAIGPLGLEELDDLLRLHLDVGFLRPTLLRIEGASSGNPFYALEIGRGLLRRGIRFAPDVLPIPDTLTAIVRERLAALSPAASAATLLAAVLATPTPAGIRSALTISGEADGLASAKDAGVLEVTLDTVRFTHPLLASVAYEAASGEDRRAAHAMAARVVEDSEEQARHLALAAEGPSEGVAATAEIAAQRARARGSSEGAAVLAELAYRLTPPGAPDDARRRAMQAAEHSIRAGDPDRAIGLLEGLSAPPGPRRAELLVALADAHSSGDWEERLLLLQDAAVEAGESPARIVAERLLAGAGMVMDRDLPGAVAHARASVRLAERFGDPTQLALSLALLCRVEAAADGTVDREALDQSLGLAPGLGLVHVIARPELAAADLLAGRSGHLAEQIRQMESIRHEAGRIGDWDAALPLTTECAELYLRSGDVERSVALAAEAEQLSHQIGQPGIRAAALNTHARILARLGRIHEATAMLDEAVVQGEIARGTGNVRVSAMIRGFIQMTAGKAAAAHDVMEPAVAQYIREGCHDPERLRDIANEIEALCQLGRVDDAERVLEPFERRAQAVGSPVIRAIAVRCRATIAAGRGDCATGQLALREIVDQSAIGEPFEQARTRLLLGELERRERRIGDARRSLTAAAEQFESLGAVPWAAKARDEVGRLAGRPPTHGLSETEREIARLVAAGGTNRGVADALFMSPHTVDSHLRRIFRALGVRSRTELAARLALSPEASVVAEVSVPAFEEGR